MAMNYLELNCNAKPSLKLGFVEKLRVTNRQERLRETCLYEIMISLDIVFCNVEIEGRQEE